MTNTTTAEVMRVRGLAKRYGDRTVLQGLDLDLAPGETYALLGPNGAGKSTAIEIFEGFRRPSGGEITVLGEDPLTAPRAWRSRIGIVSQQTGDLGPYTPRELLTHFAGLYPKPRGVDEVLALVGLAEHAARRASKLSGGQQRRLDVALGIIGRPELLFLDEPTTGFDPEARRQFWDLIRRLQDEGTTILLTTHYLDEAAELSSRAGIVAGGVMAAIGPITELGGAEARVPIVRWREKGKVREERTDAPAALVAQLAATGEPEGLEVIRPSLEDIYLSFVGRDAAEVTA